MKFNIIRVFDSRIYFAMKKYLSNFCGSNNKKQSNFEVNGNKTYKVAFFQTKRAL